MLYLIMIWKRKLEDLLMLPFIRYGRRLAGKNPLQETYGIFFLFPFYHTGGAEKVHAQIAYAFRGKKCLIIFTRRSHNEGFRKEFEQSGHRVLDISAYTDNKKTYWKNIIWRGLVSEHINRHSSSPVIINGQCNFAYKLSRWIRKDIAQIELIHSYNTFAMIRVPFLPFYNQTVMISRKAIRSYLEQYKRIGVPESFGKRIRFILNGIDLPSSAPGRLPVPDQLRILYSGRATPEKRVHLVAEIAIACKQKFPGIQFGFLGDIEPHLPASLRSAGVFYGSSSDRTFINDLYRNADILMITSSEEGFPMVIMEAMAMGCIIISTPVGDIPAHIRAGENGFLFSQVSDESKIIQESLQYFEILMKDPSLRKAMSHCNYEYAAANFGIDIFEHSWQRLLEEVKQQS